MLSKEIVHILIEPLKNTKLKIWFKKITINDIEKYNDEAINGECIYPIIYNKLNLLPFSDDILIGYKENNFDYYNDSSIIIRDGIIKRI